MLLGQAITEYMDYKKTYSRENTWKSYKFQLDRVIKFLGDAELEGIALSDLNRLHVHLKENYKPATVSFTMKVLKNFLRFLRESGYSVPSPSLIKVARYIQSDREFMTPSDLADLTRNLNETSYPSLIRKLVFNFLFETGLRVSELCAIQMDHINLKENSVMIDTLKSYTRDYVFWSQTTADLLIKYLKGREDHKYLFVTRSDDGVIRPLSVRRVQCWFTEECERAGITKKLTPHTARHGKAHKMATKGFGLHEIASVLRHKDIRSSQPYLKFVKEEQRAIFARSFS